MRLTILLFVVATLAQDVLTVLRQQSSTSQFADLLAGFPDLVDYLNEGGHTLLAPSNSALSQTPSSPSVDTRSLVEYHILKGNFALTSFPDANATPLLVPTLLTNSTQTNVTGGQRVELVSNNGQYSVLSAVRQPSPITTGNMFFQGGLVHVLDTTLRIPLSFPQTLTEANLHNLAALLTKGNWLVPDSIAYKITLQTPDLTILGPDSDQYGASYTGWDGLDQAHLDRIFTYHVIPNVVYSPDMGNVTQHPTLANLSVTSRQYTQGNASATFINQALLRASNYLTANGVLHVLDRPLDPDFPNASPLAADVNKAIGAPPPKETPAITTAALVGIVIGVLAILTTIAVVVGLRRRMRTRRQRETPPDYQSAMRDTPVPHGRVGGPQAMNMPSDRLSAPLPARPTSMIMSIRGAVWPSRPPAHALVELDAKEYGKGVGMSATDLGSEHSMRQDTRWEMPRTPPELDGRQRSRRNSFSARSGVSITFHGERPKHVGVQAQY